MRASLPLICVINKLDRLVLELKLPPVDAYFKIKHTIDEINLIIQSYHGVHQGKQTYLSPLHQNVVFASTLFSSCFTIQSFAQRYATKFSNFNSKQPVIDPSKFEKFLWGDLFYEEQTRKFKRSSEGGLQRSFVHFILEPFYKIISVAISEEKAELEPILKKEGIVLKNKEFDLDIKPLLKLVLGKFLGDLSCLVDCLTLLPNSAKGTL